MVTRTLRRLYRRWLHIAFIGLVAANLIVDGLLMPPSARSIRLHDSGSLTHLVHTEQSFLDRHYGIYLELGDAMAGGTLVVPGKGLIDPHSARGLADVTVVERDYDPMEIVSDVVPDGPPLGVVEVGDAVVSYWILPAEGDPRWWIARNPEGLVLVPESRAQLPSQPGS